MLQGPLDVRSTGCAGDGPRTSTRPEPRRVLERFTADVLRRVGFSIGPPDGALVRALVPFVIDPESLRPIPPLASPPTSGDAGLTYRNVTLAPEPVLAPVMAHLLLAGTAGVEKVFVDGHNVYGANLFEIHEGRRLLRRAVGFVREELARELDAFDVIAYESDGFLIAAHRRAAAPPLHERIRRIVARMHAPADGAFTSRDRSRLATFFRHAHGDVLATATVAYEPRDDLDRLIAARAIEARGTAAERAAQLVARDPDLAPIARLLVSRPAQDQEIALALLEHATYDPVLHTVALDMERACRVKPFRSPAALLRWAAGRPFRFFRLELVSLLKSINEHPLGGFLAGNEALRAVYVRLVDSLLDVAGRAGHGACALPTFRRWGDFYVGIEAGLAGDGEVCARIERAFDNARFVSLGSAARNAPVPGSTALVPVPPPDRPDGIVVPLVPVVTPNAELAPDLLAMPIEPPGPEKRRAIAARLADARSTPLDVAFLADWTLNACDVNRGIPRLVTLAGATDADVAELARFYQTGTNRKGKAVHRVRRDAASLEAVSATLRRLFAGGGDDAAAV